ncbi:MAG: amidohydrolase [Verrucomicrobiales bacterium]|nr:amidohydrolase [Verrucomicrobiales bacterium]
MAAVMLVIDTHAHIYADDEKRYPPIDQPLRPPGMHGTLGDLRTTSASHGVRAACLIQTSTFYRFDNRYVCDSAKVSSDWAAGICTLDPDDPHSPDLLAQYKRDFGIKGMRSIPGSSARIDAQGVRNLWKKAADEGLVINALIHRDNAENLSRMLADFNRLQVVLDHCMYPEVGAQYDAVLDDVLRLARFKNLHAKLTFVPMGSKQKYPCADLHEAVRKIVEAFGAERCVWGSDFPCELWTPGITYAQHLQIFLSELSLRDQARQQILGLTARRLWFPELTLI